MKRALLSTSTLCVCGAAGAAFAQQITPLASAPAQAHDLSPVAMFLAADPIVKSIIAGLLLASVATWTVWFAKVFELRAAKRRLLASLAALMQQRSLAEAHQQVKSGGIAPQLIAEAVAEIGMSAGLRRGGGTAERIASRLNDVEADAARKMRSGTGLLATIGSTAPFVGLLGTVWGIMNSFIGIAQSHTTNLAVVAPGIAEALLATAIGLLAAIPAVVIYNSLSRSIAGYRALARKTSAEVLRLASRDLDRAAEHGHVRAQAAE